MKSCFFYLPNKTNINMKRAIFILKREDQLEIVPYLRTTMTSTAPLARASTTPPSLREDWAARDKFRSSFQSGLSFGGRA